MLQSCIDLPAVAPGRAPPRFVLFEYNNFDTALGEVERRRQPGITSADDNYRGSRRGRK